MTTESANDPQPDDIPENQRTGDEPNPSGKTGKPSSSPGLQEPNRSGQSRRGGRFNTRRPPPDT
jgi:hypothetical protein